MKFNWVMVVLFAGLVYLPFMSYGDDDLSALQQRAQQGDAKAQFNLGYSYAHGQGVPQDYEEAMKWFRLSAAQGNAQAQNGLGVLYHSGHGVPQDYEEAMKWYRLSAEQGYAKAQCNLGGSYARGQGVPQDYEEAMKWYRLSAEQGYASAQFHLGYSYAHGQGVPHDYTEAMKWYRLSAAQGNAYAQCNLGVLYNNGQGVPPDYEEAVMWYRLSAERGDAQAQCNLGSSYARGQGVPQDYEEAMKLYRLSAEQGNAEAQSALTNLIVKVALDHKGSDGGTSSAREDSKSALGIIKNTENVGSISFPEYSPALFDGKLREAHLGSQQDRDAYFDLFGKYVKVTYAALQDRGGVVRSYTSKAETRTRRDNYALVLDDFFSQTTKAAVSPGRDAIFITKEGVEATIDNIFKSDIGAVLIKEAAQEKRVLISDLPPASRQFAKDLIADKCFETGLNISISKVRGNKWGDGLEADNNVVKEVFIYQNYTYTITLANETEMAIDDLILEYQIFFSQTVAGTQSSADTDYRFVGHSIIKIIPAGGRVVLNITPPAIAESKLRANTRTSGTTEYTTSLAYPNGCNQFSSGRMRGIWVRIQRITPNGRLTRELKEDIYPEYAEWDAVETLHNR